MTQHQITRKVEFDAGHRIPNHESKCKNIHGHRYVLEATVAGPLLKSGSQEGMVVDFGILKSVMIDEIADRWDHAFLCWVNDKAMRQALETVGDQKFVLLGSVPTAENLARTAFTSLKRPLERHGLRLIQVRLYETPNCWADYREE